MRSEIQVHASDPELRSSPNSAVSVNPKRPISSAPGTFGDATTRLEMDLMPISLYPSTPTGARHTPRINKLATSAEMEPEMESRGDICRIMSLPQELRLMILERLGATSRRALRQTNRYFRDVIDAVPLKAIFPTRDAYEHLWCKGHLRIGTKFVLVPIKSRLASSLPTHEAFPLARLFRKCPHCEVYRNCRSTVADGHVFVGIPASRFDRDYTNCCSPELVSWPPHDLGWPSGPPGSVTGWPTVVPGQGRTAFV